MNNYSKRARVGIAGFHGYSGAELVRLLAKHPNADAVLMEHRSESDDRALPLDSKQPPRIPCTPEAAKSEQVDVVFLATPTEVSLELAPKMLQTGARVIDLSGAFRLGNLETYSRWYPEKHTAPELLSEAVYGLPEYCRERIRGARFIANPGCYPTAANLAIAPLVKSGMIDRSAGIVCDAKSGVSGAGRKPSLKTSFGEVADNFSAYSILDHRHVPEVLMISGLEEGDLSFTAHLLPIHRGILETIYFRTRGVSSAEDLLAVYKRSYAAEPFIRLYPTGAVPDIHAVDRTNYCDIGIRFDAATGRGVVVSAIDNLVKGAAGQAIQNMNLALGFEETAGLL